MIPVALLLIVMALICLVILFCSEGWTWLGYRLYGEKCVASVCEETPFTLDMSKGTVEKQEQDGTFHRISATEDRSVGHLPFYYALFEKGKVQPVLQWEAEDAVWRGHYRYLKEKGTVPAGAQVEVHYQKGKPWRYAIKDPALWRQFWIKLAVYGLVLAAGIVLFVQAAG